MAAPIFRRVWHDKLLATGLAGTAIAMLCCFTPALLILFGVVGLSAWVADPAWLDLVLWPSMALFAALTAFALVRRRRAGH